MVVPTVLAIIARRNCARWSVSDNGAAVRSSVVMTNLPGSHRASPHWNAFRPHPRTWMLVLTTVCYLVGATPSLCVGPMPASGGVRHGERREPIHHRGMSIPDNTVLQLGL